MVLTLAELKVIRSLGELTSILSQTEFKLQCMPYEQTHHLNRKRKNYEVNGILWKIQQRVSSMS